MNVRIELNVRRKRRHVKFVQNLNSNNEEKRFKRRV